MSTEQDRAAEALIAWYRAMGVDEVVGETPVDCFAEAKPSPRHVAERISAVPRLASRGLGGEAATLAELEALVARFDGCALKRTAKSLCFSRGSANAPIMMIGEAPGRDEDLQGKPFVGRAGQLLDRMLAAIDIQRTDVYIANTIPWRPPGNRTPTPIEAEICRPFIERQIELVAPKILVSLGGPSAKVLTGSTDGILRMRGNWKTHVTASGREIPVMPTLHPAYLLRNPTQKRFAWRDLLAIKMRLRELTSV